MRYGSRTALLAHQGLKTVALGNDGRIEKKVGWLGLSGIISLLGHPLLPRDQDDPFSSARLELFHFEK